MRCPVCGIEMRVAERAAEARGGARYTVLKFACRNPHCGQHGRVLAQKRVEQPAKA